VDEWRARDVRGYGFDISNS